MVSRLRPVIQTFTRNTVIVKRVHKPPLVKLRDRDSLEVPRHILDKSVVHTDDDKYMVYDIEEKSQKEHKVKVILLRNVDDFGVKGQIIEFPAVSVQRDLMLPGFAVYHNQENLERYKDIVIPEETRMNSSESARWLAVMWSKRVLDVCLNTDNPWTIQPWHIKASLRKHKTWIEEKNIEIPGGEITGPDLDLENKEFIAVITVNNFEKIKVRCRIHHLSASPEKTVKLESWYFREAEPVWESERQQLLDMNRQPPSWKLLNNSKLSEEVEKYKSWKTAREERINK